MGAGHAEIPSPVCCEVCGNGGGGTVPFGAVTQRSLCGDSAGGAKKSFFDILTAARVSSRLYAALFGAWLHMPVGMLHPRGCVTLRGTVGQVFSGGVDSVPARGNNNV